MGGTPDAEGRSVLGRAFRLLSTLHEAPAGLTLAQLSRRSQLPKPTVYRIAKELQRLGAVAQSADRYVLDIKLFELGHAVETPLLLRETALPYMEDLFEASHETVHLVSPLPDAVLYVGKIAGHRTCTVSTKTGTRKPLHCTAVGKAILAHQGQDYTDRILQGELTRFTSSTITHPLRLEREIESIKNTGPAFDREEFQVGIVCVAAPILDWHGNPLGAISVTGPASRFLAHRFANSVLAAGSAISREIQNRMASARFS